MTLVVYKAAVFFLMLFYADVLLAAGAEANANQFPDFVYYLIVDVLFVGFLWIAFALMKFALRVVSWRKTSRWVVNHH